MKNRLLSQFFFALLWLSSTTLAQGPYPTSDQVSSFVSTKLLVVMDGRDIAYDALLKDAMAKHWNITEFEFIDNDTFIKESSNPDYSFLVTLQVQFDKDTEGHSYNFLYILLSHPTGNIQEMPVIAQLPFLGSTLSSSSHLHKTETLVKFLQNNASSVVSSNGHRRFRKLNHLNKGIKELSEKTLVIAESQIQPKIRDEKILKKVYKHNIKVVTEEELVRYISKAEEDIVILHIVAPDDEAESGKCYKMIVEPSTGKGYFYKVRNISEKRPGVFLKCDFRKIRWYPFHWL